MGRSRDSGYQVPVRSTPVRLSGCNGFDYEYFFLVKEGYRIGSLSSGYSYHILREPHHLNHSNHLKPLYPHNEKLDLLFISDFRECLLSTKNRLVAYLAHKEKMTIRIASVSPTDLHSPAISGAS